MPEPLYRDIADALRGQIEAGQLPPGAQLPTEVELRERYNASRNTVRDAIKWLLTGGLVETRPGQGTFVVEKIVPLLVRLGASPETGAVGDVVLHSAEPPRSRTVVVSEPRVEVLLGTGIVCEELRLPEGTQLVSRHQQRFIEFRAWSLQTSYYPMSLVQRGAPRLISPGDISYGTDQYLRETLGLALVGYSERLAVRPPDASEAAFFSLPQDGRVSVFETVRTGYDQTGTPMRVTVTVYPADRNQFVVTFGDVPSLSGQEEARPAGAAGNLVPGDRAPAVVTLER